MKKIIVFCICLSSFLPASVLASDLPPIAPGYWKVTSTSADSTESVKHCIDKNTMEKMLTSSQKMLGGSCSDLSVTSSGGTYTSKIACTMMGSAVSVNSVLKGDFSKDYTSTTTTSFNPPLMGQGGSTSTEHAVRIGDCPAGMVPGDVELADGKVINAQKMMDEMPDLGAMMQQMQSGQMPDPEKMQQLMQQMQKIQQ